MESKDDVLLASLRTFYEEPAHLRALTDAIRGHKISLRVLDWFVTNYSKRVNVVYPLEMPNGETKGFNVYCNYKSMLKGFSKLRFDPFSRRTRITILDADGNEIQTTVGQLNFFRWAIKSKVLDYSLEHAKEIEKDMLQCIKSRSSSGNTEMNKTKRRELSKAAIKTLTQTKVILTLKFG